MKTAAVIPAYFEEKRIESVIERVRPFVDLVIVVVDGSTDKTFEIAKRSGVVALRHVVNRGQGAALRTGNEAALLLGMDVIIHIDADGQHDPNSIPEFLKEIENGNDVVLGSRFMGVESIGMSFKKKVILALARQFNRLALGISSRITDPQSGYRAMTAEAARQIDFRQDRFAHCSEILRLVSRSTLKWKEIPTQVHYTADTVAKGVSTIDGFGIIWQLFLGVFQR